MSREEGMKRATAVAVLVILAAILSGCFQTPPPPIIEEPLNEPPIVSFGALHSPNGAQAHKPYQWDIHGTGYDPDGHIVSWVIEVNGDRFELGNAEVGEHGDGLRESKEITYQFPQAGWYPIRVTATDNDGASTTFMPIHADNPNRNGFWYIGS